MTGNSLMKFSDEEIEMAKQLRGLKLPWTPSVGHYVWDEHGIVDRGSPFQSGVYFILNYDHFMAMAGGVDRFRETMLWLPTWEDCRAVLRDLNVPDNSVAKELASAAAIPSGRERITLYAMIRSTLEAHV